MLTLHRGGLPVGPLGRRRCGGAEVVELNVRGSVFHETADPLTSSLCGRGIPFSRRRASSVFLFTPLNAPLRSKENNGLEDTDPGHAKTW